MVSGTTFAAILFTLAISVLFPVAIFLYFFIRYKIKPIPMLIGAGVFFVFTQILEKILHWYFLMANTGTAELFKNPFAYSVYGGLAAGIFEECGRFLAFMLILKKYRDWKDGISYGIGHGGIESILLIGMTYVNNLVFAVLINTGSLDAILSKSVSTTVISQIKNGLINTSSLLFLLAGVERVFTLALQIALSLLVLYGVLNKKIQYLFAAIFIHAAVDFPAGLCQKGILNIWFVEVILLIVAIASVAYIILSKKQFEMIKEPGLLN